MKKIFSKIGKKRKKKVIEVEGGSQRGDAYIRKGVNEKEIGLVGSTFPPPEMFLKK